MCTVNSSSRLLGWVSAGEGELSAQLDGECLPRWGGGVCPGGVCPGRCLPKRGVCLGGVCPGEGGVCLGVSAQEGVCLGVSAKVEVVSVQMEGCLPGGDVCPGEGGAICQVSVCLGGV